MRVATRDFATYNEIMTQDTLKRHIKEAITETLHDNRDAVRDLMAEVLEDVALRHAISEGENSKPVTREAVMRALARARFA